ncbi:MAG: DMT family transporter [Anaerolineae bacterium]
MNLRQWGDFWLLSLIWGASFMLIKIGLQGMDTLTLVTFRIALGALALWVVVGWRRLPLPRTGVTLGALLLLGLFNNAIPFTLITWGETTIDSGLAAVLNGTVPLFTIVIAHLWLRDERITLPKVIGLLVGFLGVVIVIREGTGELSLATLRSGTLGGQLAVVLASASYATATVFARRYLQNVHAFVLAAAQLTAGTLFISAALFLWGWPPALDTSAVIPLLAVVTLGVVNTGVAYMLYFSLLSRVGATRTTLVTYVIPAVGLFLGFIFLDEPLSLAVILGFLLIVAGVLLVNNQFVQRQSNAGPALLPAIEPESAGD